MAFPYFFNFQGQWQSLSSWRLQWQVLWVFCSSGFISSGWQCQRMFLLTQTIFLQIIFQEVLLFGKFLVNSEFWFNHGFNFKSTTNQVSWWSANSNLIGLDFTVYFLIFWLADFEYPALLIGLELLLRSLSLSTPLWPSWDLSGSAYWIELLPTNHAFLTNNVAL